MDAQPEKPDDREEQDVAAVAARALAAARARGGANSLTASAKPFVPATKGATDDEGALQLPMSHRMLLRGYTQDPATGQWISYYVGKLKTYNSRNGYGFIDCAPATNDWGQDVFVHKSCVPTPWHLGQPVEFAVTVNQRGCPQACDVNWLPKLPKDYPRPVKAPLPAKPAAAGSGNEAAADAAEPKSSDDTAEEPAAKESKERYLGTLKSFSPAQGYGFFGCESVFGKHNRDVYFDKSQVPAESTWLLGQCVEFALSFNARGHPQARSINWKPVPMTCTDPASGQAQSLPQGTVTKLQSLNEYLGKQEVETAILIAIDLQGGGGSTQVTRDEATMAAEKDIDFVSFVLDRAPPVQTAARELKDFVKMLFLLMLGKMLKQHQDHARCVNFVRWIEAAAESIDTKAEGVRQHLKEVMGQIQTHINEAFRERPQLRDIQMPTLNNTEPEVTNRTLGSVVDASMEILIKSASDVLAQPPGLASDQ